MPQPCRDKEATSSRQEAADWWSARLLNPFQHRHTLHPATVFDNRQDELGAHIQHTGSQTFLLHVHLAEHFLHAAVNQNSNGFEGKKWKSNRYQLYRNRNVKTDLCYYLITFFLASSVVYYLYLTLKLPKPHGFTLDRMTPCSVSFSKVYMTFMWYFVPRLWIYSVITTNK